MLLGEELEQLLREGDILVVEQLNVILRHVKELKRSLEQLNVVIERSG